MGTRPRWEKGQAVLHMEDQERPAVTNAYGSLRFAEKGKKEKRTENPDRHEDRNTKEKKKGFVIEAREAPGTRGHTEREKHFSAEHAAKISGGEKRFLYSPEFPFRNQAFFYDITEKKKSRKFLDCMKRMLKEQGHTTLRDAFGFLEQEPERLEKQRLEKERLRELTLEEFDTMNKWIDDLNSRLLKKEAQERQLCSRLQLMIDRSRFDINAGDISERQERGKKKEPGDWKQAGNPLELQQVSEAEENENNEDYEDEEERRQSVSEKQ